MLAEIRRLPTARRSKLNTHSSGFVSVGLHTNMYWRCGVVSSAGMDWHKTSFWDYYDPVQLCAIDAYKRHRCAWALLQWWALSNKLCILPVVRVGHPLVIWGFIWKPSRGGCRECEKPCQLSIDSIAKVTCWPCFLNAYEERHKASYRGAVDLKLYTCQDSSVATSHCQWEKPNWYTQ